MNTRTRIIYNFCARKIGALQYATAKAARKDSDLLGWRWCIPQHIDGVWYVVDRSKRRAAYLSLIGATRCA